MSLRNLVFKGWNANRTCFTLHAFRNVCPFDRWGFIEVKRPPQGAKGFVVVPMRWVGECSFAWWGRNQRLSKDYEKTTSSSEETNHREGKGKRKLDTNTT